MRIGSGIKGFGMGNILTCISFIVIVTGMFFTLQTRADETRQKLDAHCVVADAAMKDRAELIHQMQTDIAVMKGEIVSISKHLEKDDEYKRRNNELNRKIFIELKRIKLGDD